MFPCRSMKKLLFFIGILLSTGLIAAPRYEFTPLAIKAYRAILALRLSEATASIVQMRLTDPENLMSYYLEDYIETIIIFLDEDKNAYRKYSPNKDKRLLKLASGPRDSPYFLYTQAEINLHWAIARVKFGEHLSSVREASAAYKLLVRNDKLFPDFIANKKTISTLRAIFGSVPPEYRWATNLLTGIDGDVERGRRELEEVVKYTQQHSFVFGDETHMVYAFTLLYLGNQPEESWNVISRSNLKPGKSILASLAIANVGLKSGHASEVAGMLANAPRGKNYFSVPLIDYYLGVAKLTLLDENADKYLLDFLRTVKGKTAVKEALQKLAWYELIHDRESMYWHYMQRCKSEGTSVAEGDKAALREANSGIKPDAWLLKARLLFDGGQFERALTVINQKQKADYSHNKAHQLEYTYRMARIQHKLGRLAEAILLYKQTINEGKDDPYVYACNSAFQLGSIFEQKSDFGQAQRYYQMCISINPAEYASGLHQKAKAGLNRVGG